MSHLCVFSLLWPVSSLPSVHVNVASGSSEHRRLVSGVFSLASRVTSCVCGLVSLDGVLLEFFDDYLGFQGYVEVEVWHVSEFTESCHPIVFGNHE